MEIESTDSSPVLRVTTDISELKDSNECIRHSSYKPLSRESRKSHEEGAFFRKKTLHPLHGCNPYQVKINNGGSYVNIQNAKGNVSSFTQRIMSAKLLRVKQLQNQLAESQSRVTELINENKLLKTLQKRQDSALRKYEGGQEQLPQLIKSHNEEIRVINSKFKQLKLNYRILESKLKERDNELMNLKEQHKHLLKLSRDKQLGDREKLSKKLCEMEAQVKAQQEKIQVLTRKIELEGKNYRHRLNLEVSRHKETQADLREARKIIDKLKSSMEGKPKYVNTTLTKKIVRPSTLENPQSRISLPAPPPNVSIRQPQRLINSETALNRDEDSDSDSFSFGLQNIPRNDEEDTCSERSNSNGDEKPSTEGLNNKFNRTNSENTNHSNKHDFTNGSLTVSSGNSHYSTSRSSPNLVGRKSITYPKSVINTSVKAASVENKIGIPRNNTLNTKSEHKIENLNITEKGHVNKTSNRLLNIRNGPRRNSAAEALPMFQNSNKSHGKKISIRDNSFKKSVSLDSVKTEISDKINTNGNSITPEDDNERNNYDLQLKNIQKEIEKELGNVTYQNPDEGTNVLLSTNETLSHSMEAAIVELERKFKIFDMPQIRKETEDDINKIVDRACKSLIEEEINIETRNTITNETQSNQEPDIAKSENKTIDDDDFLFKLENSKSLDNPKPDLVLAESQKANLLKALNDIDKESNITDDISNYFQETNENFSSNSLQKMQVYPHVSNLINSKVKRDVMKELFSEDPTTVSTQ